VLCFFSIPRHCCKGVLTWHRRFYVMCLSSSDLLFIFLYCTASLPLSVAYTCIYTYTYTFTFPPSTYAYTARVYHPCAPLPLPPRLPRLIVKLSKGSGGRSGIGLGMSQDAYNSSSNGNGNGNSSSSNGGGKKGGGEEFKKRGGAFSDVTFESLFGVEWPRYVYVCVYASCHALLCPAALRCAVCPISGGFSSDPNPPSPPLLLSSCRSCSDYANAFF